MKNVRFPILLPLLAICSCSPKVQGDVAPPPAPAATAPAVAEEAQPLTLDGVENLYRISKDLYRSGQPKKKGFAELYRIGVRSVLNLREYHSDDSKARKVDLMLFHHRMAAGSIKEADIEKCLRYIRCAPKPVLVHCMHGSDRTGTIVAAYRIVEQGWSVEDAIAELKEKRFGYHEFWYPGIPDLLRSIDWTALRSRLDNAGKAE